MAEEPDSLILRILRGMRAELATKADLEVLRSEMATKAELQSLRSELKSDMHSLRADVASDLLVMRKELSEQIVGLRRAVVDYHPSVIGHGILISDLDARLRRVEQHLNRPPMTAG
jgi:ABC-type phosphate transport system auxiliary subunit